MYTVFKVYAMFWHRTNVSLAFVLYYSLIHRERCSSIGANEEHCIFMLTIVFSLPYSNITVVFLPNFAFTQTRVLRIPSNFRQHILAHIASRALKAGKYRLYKLGTARNCVFLLPSAPVTTRLLLLNMAKHTLILTLWKVQKVTI